MRIKIKKKPVEWRKVLVASVGDDAADSYLIITSVIDRIVKTLPAGPLVFSISKAVGPMSFVNGWAQGRGHSVVIEPRDTSDSALVAAIIFNAEKLPKLVAKLKATDVPTSTRDSFALLLNGSSYREPQYRYWKKKA